MKWTHRGTIAVAYAVIAGLVMTRPDFEYLPWLPILVVGGGSLFTVNFIVQRRVGKQGESPRVAAAREDIEIRQMERDYLNKPGRDMDKTMLKIMIGIVAFFLILVLMQAIVAGPESAPGIVAWIELLWCQCG